MAFNFFKRKKPEVLEVVEPAKPDNRIDTDLLLMQIQLMHENHYSVAKHKSGKVEPRGYCDPALVNPFIDEDGLYLFIDKDRLFAGYSDEYPELAKEAITKEEPTC